MTQKNTLLFSARIAASVSKHTFVAHGDKVSKMQTVRTMLDCPTSSSLTDLMVVPGKAFSTVLDFRQISFNVERMSTSLSLECEKSSCHEST